ncbi:unnamed protein product [Amoebophrya sp. A120]|nr:unnamed protein product [Amoebophrya sp. A120]
MAIVFGLQQSRVNGANVEARSEVSFAKAPPQVWTGCFRKERGAQKGSPGAIRFVVSVRVWASGPILEGCMAGPRGVAVAARRHALRCRANWLACCGTERGGARKQRASHATANENPPAQKRTRMDAAPRRLACLRLSC